MDGEGCNGRVVCDGHSDVDDEDYGVKDKVSRVVVTKKSTEV